LESHTSSPIGEPPLWCNYHSYFMATETHYAWDGEKWQCKDDPDWQSKPVSEPEVTPKPAHSRLSTPARGRKPKESK